MTLWRLDPPHSFEVALRFFKKWLSIHPHSNSPMLNRLTAKRAPDRLFQQNGPQPPRHIHVRRCAINLALTLVRLGGNCFLLQMLPAKAMQFIQLPDH